MEIVACYKCVPDDQDIKVASDRTLDYSKAAWKVGQYDLSAVEAGMQLFEQQGGSMSVLTAGGATSTNSKMKKAILARGPQQLYAVEDESLADADSLTTAQVLAAAVQKIGNVDLVLCGEGSSDMYEQQVGGVLGAILGWPTINSVSAIECADDKLAVEREVEDGVESFEIDLPCVLCTTSSIKKARIASMKDILAAGKKPSTVWALADVAPETGAVVETVSILAPESVDRAQDVIEGDGDDQIDELFSKLSKMM